MRGRGTPRCLAGAGLWLRALPFALVALVAAGDAAAQALPRELPGAVQPGRDRPPVLPAPNDNEFDFTIESPRRSPVPQAADQLVFTLSDIRITGAKTFPPETLRPLYEPLLGKEVKLADILDVADAIEAKYRTAGYALARAFVPPQRVSDGVFSITVVEGFVNAIEVEGGSEATRRRVRAYLEPILASRPLLISTLERALLLANDLPGVAASGLLRPATNQPGASDLVVTLTTTAASGGLGIDNRGSKFAGPWTVRGDVTVAPIFSGGDELFASFSSVPDSAEKMEGFVRYSHPLGNDGLVLSFDASGSYGEPGNSLAPFSLVTDSYAAGPRLRYPLVRSRAESLYLDTGFTWQDAQVTTLNSPFSHDRWRVLDAALTYAESGFLDGASSATLGVAQGLPILGASPNGTASLSRPGANTDFTKVTFSLRRAQPLYEALSLAGNVSAQYAFAPLVAGEQIAFGGDTIGRGYDPDVLQGDYGVGTSLELRYDLRFPDELIETAQPYLFYENARVWNRIGGPTGGTHLSSTGLGLRITLPHQISAGLEVAHTLSRLAGNDDGKLGSRLLFNAGIRF
jgi:hemolysin activation/secretion protein